MPTKIPDSAHRLFETDRYATFVTLNQDGSPQVSMMWISRDGDDLLFGVESRRVKVANLRRNPKVTVMIEDTENTPEGLRQHLVVQGTVSFTGPDLGEKWTDFMDRQSHRYLGTDFPFPNRVSSTGLIGRITVEKVSGIGPWAR